ncbi:MAG TPA: hypothetical protein VHC95_06950 [Opitutales bacterium]|nr:hypothetical protein [Opitutales bacterium]
MNGLAKQLKLQRLRLMDPARAVERVTELQDGVAELEMLAALAKKANKRMAAMLRARRVAAGISESQFCQVLGLTREQLHALEFGAEAWTPSAARMYAQACEANYRPKIRKTPEAAPAPAIQEGAA